MATPLGIKVLPSDLLVKSPLLRPESEACPSDVSFGDKGGGCWRICMSWGAISEGIWKRTRLGNFIWWLKCSSEVTMVELSVREDFCCFLFSNLCSSGFNILADGFVSPPPHPINSLYSTSCAHGTRIVLDQAKPLAICLSNLTEPGLHMFLLLSL